jgi:hypothetical protein
MKVKVGKDVEFRLDGEVEKGRILSISMDGLSVVVKYRLNLKTVVKLTDIINNTEKK